MRLCSIASGSSGNCIYIGSENTHLLVDAGISKKRIEEGLNEIGLKAEEITAIFITHEHIDHIQGLGVFARKYEVPIYASSGTIRGIQACKTIGKLPENIMHAIETDTVFEIGDLQVKPFCISHDANEPTAFRIEGENKAIGIATDLGMYDDYIVENLKNLTAVLLEANHDTHMVEVGPYPYHLKQRVLGTKGHLSNELSGRLLCDIIHEKLKYVLLGHLSKDNNYAELAYETVKLEVTLSKQPFHGNDIPILVADRDNISKIINI